jgi:hypothetical protein
LQSSAEKRRLLGLVLSNSLWKDGRLTAEYREPFYFLAKNVVELRQSGEEKGSKTPISDIWLRLLGSNQRPTD